MGNVVILTGGTGTVKLIRGLYTLIPNRMSIISNTGDDWNFYGLYVSPDTDAVLYALSDQLDTTKMWGIKGDTYHIRDVLLSLDSSTEPVASWFNLGDIDLAHCLYRTSLLHQGVSLTEATNYLRTQLKIQAKIFPMCNESVQTMFTTPDGPFHIEEFFIKHRGQKSILSVNYEGSSDATLVDELKSEIRDATAIIIGPSNPISSIGPILAISEITSAINDTIAKKIVISPIIGNNPISGPAGNYMLAKGYEVSPLGIFNLYKDVADIFIFHDSDEHQYNYLRDDNAKSIYFHDILWSDRAAEIEFAHWLSKNILSII